MSFPDFLVVFGQHQLEELIRHWHGQEIITRESRIEVILLSGDRKQKPEIKQKLWQREPSGRDSGQIWWREADETYVYWYLLVQF